MLRFFWLALDFSQKSALMRYLGTLKKFENSRVNLVHKAVVQSSTPDLRTENTLLDLLTSGNGKEW
jgi:hypothetical protein